LISVSGLTELVEICRDVFWRGRRWVPLDHIAGLVDEEFLKVPGDVIGLAFAGLRVLEHLIEGGGAGTVHFDLREHGEVHIELRGCEFKDLSVGAGLLVRELVARKSEHDDVVVFIVKRTQTCVLRGEASSAGDVDDQRKVALELVEAHLFAGDGRHFEIMEVGHGANIVGSTAIDRVPFESRMGRGCGEDAAWWR
jgi:hypothetical protein